MFGLSQGGTEAATAVLELGRQPSIIRRAERKLLQAAAAPPHVSSIYDIVILVFVAVGQDFPPDIIIMHLRLITFKELITIPTPWQYTFYMFTSLLIEISHLFDQIQDKKK